MLELGLGEAAAWGFVWLVLMNGSNLRKNFVNSQFIMQKIRFCTKWSKQIRSDLIWSFTSAYYRLRSCFLLIVTPCIVIQSNSNLRVDEWMILTFLFYNNEQFKHLDAYSLVISALWWYFGAYVLRALQFCMDRKKLRLEVRDQSHQRNSSNRFEQDLRLWELGEATV